MKNSAVNAPLEWVPGVHVLVDDDAETCGYVTRRMASGRYLLTPGADGDRFRGGRIPADLRWWAR